MASKRRRRIAKILVGTPVALLIAPRILDEEAIDAIADVGFNALLSIACVFVRGDASTSSLTSTMSS